MAKPNKKGKAQRGSQGGQKFDENALSQLTSKIDKSLPSSDHKRKQPPTNDLGKQGRKRQRNSGNGPSKPAIKNENDALLQEIRELGGDEKDLELIKDIDSSDEELVKDSKQPVDKRLNDELAALSKELGFADYQPSEASDVEQDEDEDDEVESQDDDGDDDDEENNENEVEDDGEENQEDQPPRKVGNLTFEPRADWHAAKLPELPGPLKGQAAPFTEALKSHAKTLLDDDAAKYRTSVFASSSHKFLSTIMSSGTLTDKVSALTLAVQESPLHNIKAFDALMNLASKKSRAQAIGAIGALVDLLGPGTVLPSDRRLKTFANQPGLIGTLQRSTKPWKPGQPLPGKITDAHLIAWIYEDWLKDTYFKILQLLEVWSSDEIEYSRSRALDFVYGLLKDKPEQESNLLRLLVNKLGDRDRKIASRASYLLLQLQTSHPGMKPIIVRTVEQEILLHPSHDHRIKYTTVNTLNQTILSKKEPEVAESLMRVYFDLFVTLLKAGSLGIGAHTDGGKPNGNDQKTGKPSGKPPSKNSPSKPSDQDIEAADKLVSAILTGVNRAAPFISANEAIMENHLDTLFKIAHSANFNTGIQALLLIQHLSSARNLGTDRFYRTLYESLLDPRLVSSSKQALYLNLLLRALKDDVDVRRVKAFVKRMLQISSLHQPPFVCGLLYVVAHLREAFPDLATLIEEPEESIFDDEPAEQRPAYDGRKRDPEYSNAQRSCLWEMIPVQVHFHPSVSVFVSALVDRDQKVQKPDLDSHSLIRFLDKFVYKNPKATDRARGVSIMQPLKATKDLGDAWLGSRGAGSAPTSVNKSAFWNKKSEDVAAEDAFFHKYFQNAAKDPKKPKAKASAGEGDEDEEENEIWKALVSAQPDIDGDDGGSEGFDDLDDEEMATDDDEPPAMSLDGDSDDEMEGVDIEGDDEDEDAASDGLVAVDEGEDEDGSEIEEKDKEKEKRKSRRKQLKDLPMFASADDYTELLAQEEDEVF